MSKPDMQERHVRIILDDDSKTFLLLDMDGKVITGGENPKVLSRYAFDHGAISVRHEYDLKVAE